MSLGIGPLSTGAPSSVNVNALPGVSVKSNAVALPDGFVTLSTRMWARSVLVKTQVTHSPLARLIVAVSVPTLTGTILSVTVLVQTRLVPSKSDVSSVSVSVYVSGERFSKS